MTFLSWLLAITVLIGLMVQTVAFHKSTVCRQEAWLRGTEMLTRALLTSPRVLERNWHLSCRIHLTRHNNLVKWQRLPHLKSHSFELDLKGSL
jgi:hypothetical protein